MLSHLSAPPPLSTHTFLGNFWEIGLPWWCISLTKWCAPSMLHAPHCLKKTVNSCVKVNNHILRSGVSYSEVVFIWLCVQYTMFTK